MSYLFIMIAFKIKLFQYQLTNPLLYQNPLTTKHQISEFTYMRYCFLLKYLNNLQTMTK